MIESATLDDFSCKFLSSLGADLWRPVLYDVQRSKLSWYIMVPQQPQCSLPRILASYGVKPLHGERRAIRPAGEKIESTAVWRLGAWCHYQPFISRFGIFWMQKGAVSDGGIRSNGLLPLKSDFFDLIVVDPCAAEIS